MEDPVPSLLEKFGVPYLYPCQELVIRRILEEPGQDQIVLFPTGAGKSLCFLLPSQALPHLTLVVYPLRALAADQVRRCRESGISCCLLQGGQTKEQRNLVWNQLDRGESRLLMTNPETILQPPVLKKLKSYRFSHVVIDEAHCVSLWGKTFRPAYLQLGQVLGELQGERTTALTATASESILNDIRHFLFHDHETLILRVSPDRPNIFYRHAPYLSFRLTLSRLVSRSEKPLIIFCRSRERVRALAQMLWYEGHAAQFYHAGMTKEEKKGVEDWFFHSSEGVLVSTNAYGMGVDKKNIRTVIHTEPAPTTEDYLQESGRAGRDGYPATAVLMRPARAEELRETPTCRRKTLLEVLDFPAEDCAGCDVCRGELPWPAELGQACEALSDHKKQLTAEETRALLRGLPSAEGLRRWKGWALWKDYDDLVAEELWKGLTEGAWVSFYPKGWWKGLIGKTALS